MPAPTARTASSASASVHVVLHVVGHVVVDDQVEQLDVQAARQHGRRDEERADAALEVGQRLVAVALVLGFFGTAGARRGSEAVTGRSARVTSAHTTVGEVGGCTPCPTLRHCMRASATTYFAAVDDQAGIALSQELPEEHVGSVLAVHKDERPLLGVEPVYMSEPAR